jgi:hypothetical protein
MAYHIDPLTGDLVIDTFQAGIGASPYSGLTDAKNINITSVPGEAAINFGTASIAPQGSVPPTTVTAIGSGSGGGFSFAPTLGLENGMAIYFTTKGSVTGIQTNTPYWIYNIAYTLGVPTSFSLYTLYGNYSQATSLTPVNVGGTLGAGASFSSYYVQNNASNNVNGPRYFTKSLSNNFMVDGLGQVWSDIGLTGTTSSWTYMGNTTLTNSQGNGLVYLRTPNLTSTSTFYDGWLFVFRDFCIDYMQIESETGLITGPTWVYGWDPSAGSSGHTYNVLNGSFFHQAIVGPDANMYFINALSNIGGTLYGGTGQVAKITVAFTDSSYTAFNPAAAPSASNYFYNTYPIIQPNDQATCLAYFGANVLVGGQSNYIYVWDTFDSKNTSWIYLAENCTTNIVVVNVNAYIFCGNRGNIYITNGSQANVWTKIPDHLSGIVEPIIAFKGATFHKGQLYFGMDMQTQAGVSLGVSGGVWGIDLTSQALRMAQTLSYGSYAGYASAIMGGTESSTAFILPDNDPPGTGIYIGWYNPGGSSGLDASVGTVSTQSAVIVSDIIPVGTLLHKETPTGFEFKLSAPLLTGESVQLLVASSLADYANNNFTSIFTTNGDASGTILSDNSANHVGTTIESQQWLILKAILTYTSGTPSYNRLVQLRIIGDTLKDSIPTQPYSLA